MDFEKTVKELEKIVASLESGELTLDESLEQYKKGITLANECKKTLDSAKLEIEVISDGQEN